MQIRLSRDISAVERGRALAFCQAAEGYSYLQDPDWIAHAPAPAGGRHDYRHVQVLDDAGGLMAYGLLRRTRLPGGYALGAFRRGPVTARPQDLGPVLDALLPALTDQGYIAVTANPRWQDADADLAEAALRGDARSGRPEGTVARPARQRLHSATGLIDLSTEYSSLLAACGAHARRKLRKLEKMQIAIRPVEGQGDWDLFRQWRDRFAKDRSLDLRGQPGLEAQQAWVAARGGDFAMIEVDGAPFGAFSMLRDGPRLLNVGLAWADPNTKLPRSYIAYWHVLRQDHTGPGAPRWLDVAGLADPRVKRQDPGAEGRDTFKQGFPMKRVRLTRVHRFVLRPALFAALTALRPGLK